MILQEMPRRQAEKVREMASHAPLSNPEVAFPEWYLHRWHFLPEGYLSARSAAGYDRLIRNVYNAFQEHRITRDVARRIHSLRPESVLEVGSGPGRLLAKLARIPSIQRLTGMDLSPYLLERASARLMGRDVELHHADGLNLAVTDGEYDLATASHYVGHLPGPLRRRAVEELARSVHPGGHVVVVDHRWHSWPETPLLRKTAEAFYGLNAIRLSVFERVEVAHA